MDGHGSRRDHRPADDRDSHRRNDHPRDDRGPDRPEDRDDRGRRRPDPRDRDAGGRARNARPRDATGRPLTRDATGTDPVADPDRPRSPDEALDEAQRLLDAGRPFTAHEVLETAWKAAEGPDRSLWQGLAQLAVGLTHAQRGNATGAVALLERGAERIAPFAAEPPHGVDVAGLVAHAGTLVERIRTGGLDDVTDDDRRPRLR